MSQTAGRLWSHNDSGEPVLYALDVHGAVTGRIQLSGIRLFDWEAVAVGPCPSGSCVFIGDIGDNRASRDRITVFRIPEPVGSTASVGVHDAFYATYPDGPQDAETLLVAPDGALFIVTKGDTGPVVLYRFPRELHSGAMHRLERVGAPIHAGKPRPDQRITDGAISSDGRWVALRTHTYLFFLSYGDLTKGAWDQAQRVDVSSIHEPQGEGVAFGPDHTMYLASEGGGASQPGTVASLTCTF